jgi:hypothetical protein
MLVNELEKQIDRKNSVNRFKRIVSLNTFNKSSWKEGKSFKARLENVWQINEIGKEVSTIF